ncbi:hypothetical protein ACFVWT_04135 [Arthrobacter sp. NPDC058288]|uniref:hypothetical protein n=1 Tax=Arthrobacter sp. NPDC058288 TaxID=3346424 RepID=UPI0036E8EC7A
MTEAKENRSEGLRSGSNDLGGSAPESSGHAHAAPMTWEAYEQASAVLMRRRKRYRTEMEGLDPGSARWRELLALSLEMTDIRAEMLEQTMRPGDGA